MLKRCIVTLLLTLFLVAIAAFSYLKSAWQQPLTFKSDFYQVQPGWSYYRVVADLHQQGQINTILPYKILLWLKPEYRHVKAGRFAIAEQKIPFEAFIQLLINAKELQYKLTLIEGMRWQDWQSLLNKQAELTHTLERHPSEQLIKLITGENQYKTLEGLLLPETYSFTASSIDISVIKQAYVAMEKLLADHQTNIQLSGLSQYEVLILASIIEKETAVVAEMPRVSGVFHNRLNKKMRLQTDPTVIYGLGEAYKGDITRAHLKQKTPYNTYTIKGLPPTPIAMPSKTAVLAAIYPEITDYLYFVANGKGGHQFSTTLKAHNKAVQAYLKSQGH